MNNLSLRTIELEWPISISHPLTSEEHELLCQLYEEKLAYQIHSDLIKSRAIRKIVVKEELNGGFSGARVLVIVPIDYLGRYRPDRVVKIGPKVMLETEHDNYSNFVEDYLPMGVAIQKRFAIHGSLAAIEYVFVGGKRLDPVDDLVSYYKSHSSQQIAKVLKDLIDYLSECWYCQGQYEKELLRDEYGFHLPEQLTLMLRPKSNDLLWSESKKKQKNTEGYHSINNDILLREHKPAKSGDLVQINNLEVVRIKPWAMTLEHKQERWARVRVEYKPENNIAQQLQIGQSVSVRGWVIATRQSLLETTVKIAFKDHSEVQVSSRDNQVLVGLGRGSYPNPLQLYPSLLDNMFEGNRSIIHGDLHPRNILIDRQSQPWLIDFGRVREGHTLFDFIKLESYLRLDILSRMYSFSLAEYMSFEEALAGATYYGLKTANPPAQRDLLKAFRVILTIRQLAARFYGYGEHDDQVRTYFRCLLLYNLALLKYSRKAVFGEIGNSEEKQYQLQSARLCFIAAAVQSGWLEKPLPHRLSIRGMLEQYRQSSG